MQIGLMKKRLASASRFLRFNIVLIVKNFSVDIVNLDEAILIDGKENLVVL